MNKQIRGTAKLSHEEFLDKLRTVNSYFKDDCFKVVGEYDSGKILTENKYGRCLSNYHDLLRGCNISIETAINKTEYFKQMLKEKNNGIYSEIEIISEYVNSFDKIRVKSNIGVLLLTPSKLFSTKRISIESAEDKNKTYKIISKNRNPNFKNTDYSNFKYDGMISKGEFKCTKHSIKYSQENKAHLNGRNGCHKCNKGITFYDENTVKTLDLFGKVYFVKMTNEEETFFKVGITSVDSEKRVKELRRLYEVEKLLEIESNIAESYSTEQFVLNSLSKSKYTPLSRFTGHSECLSENPAIFIEDVYRSYILHKNSFDNDLAKEYGINNLI